MCTVHINNVVVWVIEDETQSTQGYMFDGCRVIEVKKVVIDISPYGGLGICLTMRRLPYLILLYPKPIRTVIDTQCYVCGFALI